MLEGTKAHGVYDTYSKGIFREAGNDEMRR